MVLFINDNSLTHFEIYGEQRTVVAEFFQSGFWLAGRANGNGRLLAYYNRHGRKQHVAWRPHVPRPSRFEWLECSTSRVPALDEPVEVVKSLGGSVVRPKTAVPRAAWLTMVRDPAEKTSSACGRRTQLPFFCRSQASFTRSERRKERIHYTDNMLRNRGREQPCQ